MKTRALKRIPILLLMTIILTCLFVPQHSSAQIDLGQTSENIQRSNFFSDSDVTIEFRNSNYKVTSFKISILPPHMDAILDVPSVGNKIPAIINESIRQAPKGTLITF